MEAKGHTPFILAAVPLIYDIASLIAEFVGPRCVDSGVCDIECACLSTPCARCKMPVCEAHCMLWKPEYIQLCSRCEPPDCGPACLSHKVFRGSERCALYDGMRRCMGCSDVICRQNERPVCEFCHYNAANPM